MHTTQLRSFSHKVTEEGNLNWIMAELHHTRGTCLRPLYKKIEEKKTLKPSFELQTPLILRPPLTTMPASINLSYNVWSIKVCDCKIMAEPQPSNEKVGGSAPEWWHCALFTFLLLMSYSIFDCVLLGWEWTVSNIYRPPTQGCRSFYPHAVFIKAPSSA